MTDIVTHIGNSVHAPTIRCYIDGKQVSPISVEVDTGFDSVSASAAILLGTVPSWIDFNQDVEIQLGYDGRVTTIFKGFVEDDGRGYSDRGFDSTIKGAGSMALAQQQYQQQVNYTSQTDLQIVTDLLGTRAGITKYDLDSAGTTLGTVQDVVLRAGETPAGLIDQIDQLFGYKTFDCPDGVVRRRLVLGVPAAAAAFSYVQGLPGSGEFPILQISRPRTVRDVHNKVAVTGLPQTTFTPSSTRRADSPYTRGKDITYDFQSELIETNAVASTVSSQLMTQVNRIVEEISMTVPGNPYLQPGITISVTSEKVGLSGATNFFVKHCRHTFNEQGYVTELLLEGGIGDAGYELSKPPEPAFTYVITLETWGGTAYATIAADGSPTTDPDSSPDTLTYSWSNNENGTTGTATTYAVTWTRTQLDSGTATITLVVTDGDSNSGTVTQTIDGSVDPVITRQLYLSSDSQSEATPDGGSSWNVYTAGTARATPEIAMEGTGLYGIGSALYQTTDYLATSPTSIHTFTGGTVQAVWVNEIDADRVSVGMSGGQVYQTTDYVDGTAATWTLLDSFAAPVNHVIEASGQFGQYWVASGSAIWISFDSLATKGTHISFASTATAQHIALSTFNNYGCSIGGASTDAVIREDGVSIVPTDGAADIFSITHHIRDDILWGVGASGTNAIVYRKDPGGTTMAPIGTITGAGTPHRILRDGDNQFALYLAADNGAYKSADGGVTWNVMRSGAGPYWQAGYGSAQTVLSTTGNVYLGVGAGGSTTGGLLKRVAANTWSQIGAGTIGDVTHLASPKGHASTVYVAGSTGHGGTSKLWVTADAGASFTDLTSTLPVPANTITGLACLDSNAAVIYLSSSDSTSHGIWKSADTGATWTQVYSSASPSNGIYKTSGYLRFIGVNPGNASEIYGYLDGSDTANWYAEGDLLGGPFHVGIRGDDTVSVAFRAPAVGNFTGYYFSGGGIYTVTTPTVSFTGGGPAAAYVADANTIYCLWTASNKTAFLKLSVTSLQASPAVVLGTWSQRVNIAENHQAGTLGLAADPNDANTFWFVTTNPSVYYSTTDGLTWTKETVDLLSGGYNCILVTG